MSASSVYKTVQATTASKERTLLLLLEAILKHMRIAAAALDRKDMATARPSIERANDIIYMLQCTLKPEQAPELCASLRDIYTFVHLRLIKAMASRDSKWIHEAERVFLPIEQAFQQAVKIVQQNGQ